MTDTVPATPRPEQTSTLPRPRPMRPWLRWTLVTAYLLAALWALYVGLNLRKDIWFQTNGAHFQGDISSAWNWGELANTTGLFHFYDTVRDQNALGQNRKNDYPPLRLTVVTLWEAWTLRHYPDATAWRDDYDFTAPLLHTNTAAELLSSILVFLLIRFWTIRMDDAHRPPLVAPRAFRGWASGFAGALLMWFNPAVLWNGHCWPQWDIWLVPFFLAAALASSANWWFCSGFLVLVGAFFKGQMLLGAPVLLLWPLLELRFGAAARWACGFATAAALLSLPWMNPSRNAMVWLALVALGLGLLAPFVWRARLRWYWLAGLAILALLAVWPWTSIAPAAQKFAILVPLELVLLSRYFRSTRPYALALTLACAAFLTIPLFGSSTAWYSLGFEFGAKKFETMMTGTGTLNIPRMLNVYLRWSRDPLQLVTIPFTTIQLTFEKAVRILYGITLLLCGAGAALQSRRRDTRILAALAAPWLLFYLLLTQMHGRYPIWAAALAPLLAGISPGMALLAALISIVSASGIIENQLYFEPDWNRDFFSLLNRLNPGTGWLLILGAAIYLYTALSPRRRPYVTPPLSEAPLASAATPEVARASSP